MQTPAGDDVSKEGDLIKIQDNNFSSSKLREAANRDGNEAKYVMSEKGASNDRDGGASLGLPWAQSNLNGFIKSSQSQKRLNAMRKQLNQNSK